MYTASPLVSIPKVCLLLRQRRQLTDDRLQTNAARLASIECRHLVAECELPLLGSSHWLIVHAAFRLGRVNFPLHYDDGLTYVCTAIAFLSEASRAPDGAASWACKASRPTSRPRCGLASCPSSHLKGSGCPSLLRRGIGLAHPALIYVTCECTRVSLQNRRGVVWDDLVCYSSMLECRRFS
jgi:hypothetical protein